MRFFRFILSALCLYLVGTRQVCAQRLGSCTVRTVVGSPTTSGGDGGQALSAELFRPNGIATDGDGNLYVADQFNHKIHLVTPDGVISTFAGTGVPGFSGDGGLASEAMFNFPASVAVSSDGTVFVADRGNSRIRRIMIDGRISTVVGTGDAGFGGDGGLATSARIYFPSSVVYDGVNLYIADQGNFRVRVVDAAGVINTYAGNGGNAGLGRFAFIAKDHAPATTVPHSPVFALALDSQGRLYVGQSGSVLRVLADRTVEYLVGPRFGSSERATDGDAALTVAPSASAIAVNADGVLYVAGLALSVPPNELRSA